MKKVKNVEIFQAFSALSDAQTAIEVGAEPDQINLLIGHAKHHLFKIMGLWSPDESHEAMALYGECNYGLR